MATIFPPFRSLAPRTALQWTANNVPLGGAVIDGNDADFAAIVGGEQVTIGRFGSPATLITMIAGDVSAALVAARINATFAGLASVNANGGIRLRNATSVEVTTISAPDQVKLGLPAALSRDASLGLQSTVRPDRSFLFDRVDFVSAPVTVPDGANRAAIWLKILAVDATEVGSRFLFGFSNGVEGEVSTSVLDLSLVADFKTAVESSGDRVVRPVLDTLYIPASNPGVPSIIAAEVDVPPGATKLHVTVLAAEDLTGTLGFSPPIISGGVVLGVR